MTAKITDELHGAYRVARSAVLYGMTGTCAMDADGVTEDEALSMAAEFFHLLNPLFERFAPVRTSPDAVRAWLRREGWRQVGSTRGADLWQGPEEYPLFEVLVPNSHAGDFSKRWPEMWDWLSELTGQSVDELISAVALRSEGSA